jgi:N-acetylglucosamine-6-phosphate deacetylase
LFNGEKAMTEAIAPEEAMTPEIVSGNSGNSGNFINVRLPRQSGLFYLRWDRGAIADMGLMTDCPLVEPGHCLDLAGDWLSWGGIDLQINGGLGLAFPDLEPKDYPKLREICAYLWQQGVDGFLPTIVTTSPAKIQRSLSTLADFMAAQASEHPLATQEARVLGIHLEGPFLNYEKRGAHPEQYLLPLNVQNVKSILGDYASVVKVMTLAPELDPTGEAIAYLRSLGIIVSLGHSMATAAQAGQAFDQGATMITHAFNAMPGLHHREPGLLGAAMVDPRVHCGLIADGQHVCPTMIQVLLRASQGVFLVSDALAPIGLTDGVYPWDRRQIEVKSGTCKLLDGTLAGTTLPLLSGVENLVKWDLCDVGEAIALATEAPRKAIGLPEMSPEMAIGQANPLLRWHQDPATAHLSWQRLAEISPG